MTRSVLALAPALLALATVAPAPAADGPQPPDDVDTLLKALRGENRQVFQGPYSRLERLFEQRGAGPEAVARRFLGRRAEVIDDEAVGNRLAEAARSSPVRAALWLLEIARARETARRYARGGVVVGRLLVRGGGLEPELVMAQMPILPGGYFAGEVGDLAGSISFRAHGYQNVDVSLRDRGTSEGVADVGTVTMEPLPKDDRATVRGTVVLDDPRAAGTVVARLSVSVGPLNTPHNGYSPRRRWPEPVVVAVDKSGEFTAEGLSPTRYDLGLSAKGHVDSRATVELGPGRTADSGITRLASADLGFYIKQPAPKAPELAWETDYPTALKKGRAAGKPLMILMTAEWCGPCRVLESETLSDPWVRHFLSGFVLVKAYEDRSVESTYGMNGYPTLVFTEGPGRPAFRSVGYKPTLLFAREIARAHERLGLEMPAALRALVDRNVVPAGR